MRVVVLGAGFGGVELTSTLSEQFGTDIDIVLIDKAEGFVFGFNKLDVMFGHAKPDEVLHPYVDLVKPGVRFVSSTIRAIDPATKHVETDAGDFDADVLVIALGADLDPSATPGLLEAGHEFYTVDGAFACRDVIDAFDGGHVVVDFTSAPFKCPPAPSETALLMHDFLDKRGLLSRSKVSLVMPLPSPVPPSPDASAVLLAAFEERGIDWYPNRIVRSLDASRKVAQFADGDELAFDLFLGTPRHLAPHVVVDAGLTTDGWIAVDPSTLQ